MTGPLEVGVLAGWDPGALLAAAGDLEDEAELLHRVRREVERLVDGLLVTAWTGQTARAARTLAAELAEQVARESAAGRACGSVLRTCAGQLATARESLLRAGALARAHALALEPDGTVRPPAPDLLALGSALPQPGGGRWVEGLGAAQAAQALARDALADAERADRHAGQALTDAGARRAPASGPRRPLLAPLAEVAGWPAADVVTWWQALPPHRQAALEQADPDALGALEGLPLHVRDRANRAVLARQRADTAAALAALAPTARGAPVGRLGLQARDGVLRAVEGQLERVPGARLLQLDAEGPGQAVVVLGDLDAADHVAVVVPGMGTDVAGDLADLLEDTERLYEAAREQATATSPSGRAPGVAALAWLGYDAPDGLQAVRSASASAGAVRLQATLRGLQARSVDGRTSRPVHLTVVGHSYGSVVTGLALRRATGVGDAVLLGSPGVGARHARELQVPPGRVHVAQARRDLVARAGWFGRDPASRAFGAQVLQSDGGPARQRASAGHSDYLEAGTESLRNVALVTVGRAELASYAPAVQVPAHLNR